jgi:hypothetical protein
MNPTSVYIIQVELDELMLPDLPITDYNTRYSGIKAQMMKDVTTRVADVNARIIRLLSPQAFLVGHSLENDLRGLKLLRGRVLDTADLYPHPRGLPVRFSLRVLAQQCALSLFDFLCSVLWPSCQQHIERLCFIQSSLLIVGCGVDRSRAIIGSCTIHPCL